ncbi:translation initiation factor IF-2, mitochondrial [Onthophagus taurus]|uniref:translation initiation factor IF-2, mitochondrial n=1 Tax=Onthophagus taurus TaxID=166361 RepID=UPI0039BE67FB
MGIYSRCVLFSKIYTPGLKKSAFLSLNSIQRLITLKREKTLTINSILSVNIHNSTNLLKRRKDSEERKKPNLREYSPKQKLEVIDVWRNITVKELAEIMNKNTSYIEELFLNNIKGSSTVLSDLKELQLAIRRSGKRMRIIPKPSETEDFQDEDVSPRPPPDPSVLQRRPPVVTVMGHVDHGKTTLLDSLRHSNVVDREFGGITQHIGAFSVSLDSGARVTFLDTPGHAAFTSMRERGANITDIVVLVVAADDGVMEQTVESVRMAKQANVPILVAINKIDAPKANVQRTEQMLLEIGIQVENQGGDVQSVPISALKKKNLDQLTEALVLQADLLQIKADPTGPAEGVIIESKLDRHRGKLCTAIVQRGTLKKAAVLVAGNVMGKVRVLRDADGKVLDEVKPGYPVEIEGWKDLPQAGDIILEVETEKKARNVLKTREEKNVKDKEEENLAIIEAKEKEHSKIYQEKLKLRRSLGRFKLRPEGPRKPEYERDDTSPHLNIILKCDVNGTLEAILNVLSTYESQECPLDIVHFAVGPITESDVELAKAFNAVIYTFNVTNPENIINDANNSKLSIQQHNVIYKLIDDVKEQINSRLPMKEVEEIVGEAQVLQQFEINEGKRKVPVAGSRCTKGVLKKNLMYRLVRDGSPIYEGSLFSMRHLKNEVDTIKKGLECGLQLLDRDIKFEQGDVLICFEKKMEKQKTDWDPGF